MVDVNGLVCAMGLRDIYNWATSTIGWWIGIIPDEQPAQKQVDVQVRATRTTAEGSSEPLSDMLRIEITNHGLEAIYLSEVGVNYADGSGSALADPFGHLHASMPLKVEPGGTAIAQVDVSSHGQAGIFSVGVRTTYGQIITRSVEPRSRTGH